MKNSVKINKISISKNISSLDGIKSELENIKSKGFIKTHRSGNTGVGKTLEDLLGITENNFSIPDIGFAELKATRATKSNLLTLFTKSPDEFGANKRLLVDYGYDVGNGLELHTNLDANNFNNLKGSPFIKVQFDERKKKLYYQHYYDKKIDYLSYSYDTLINAFTVKYPSGTMIYVIADTKGKGINEEFWYKEAYFLEGFDSKKFLKMLKEGNIYINIRLGVYDDGSVHDHGTAFRIPHKKLFSCFNKATKIL